MDDRSLNSQSDRLGPVPVEIAVQVCRQTITMDQFLTWTLGTVLSFDESALSPLTLCIGSKTVGEGRAVKIGSQLGIRVQRIGRA